LCLCSFFINNFTSLSAFFTVFCHDTLFERGLDCVRIGRKYDQDVEKLKKTINQVDSVRNDLKKSNKSQQAQILQEKRASAAQKAIEEQAVLTTEAVSQLAAYVETSKEQKRHRTKQKKMATIKKLICEELREAQANRRRHSQTEAASQPRRLSVKEKNQMSDGQDVLTNMLKMEAADQRYAFNYQWLKI